MEYVFASFVFLILTAFFSLAEGALISISPSRLAERFGQERLRELNGYLERQDRILAASMLLDLCSNVGFTMTIAHFVLVHSAISGLFGFFLTCLICWIVLVPFGEALPRIWGTRQSASVLHKLFPLLDWVTRILWPIVGFFNQVHTVLQRAAGIQEQSQADMIEDQLQTVVDKGKQQGVLKDDERDMIESIIDIKDVDVMEVMTPRTDLICIEAASSLPEVAGIAKEHPFSRFPIYEESKDNIIGVLNVKDLFRYWDGGEKTKTAKDLAVPPVFVPETKKIGELLREMQTLKFRMAVVLDEYGGTAGVVTAEDIVEEIVGEIPEEGEAEDIPFRSIDPHTVEVDGKFHLDELNDLCNLDIPESEHYDTVAGFVFSSLGRVPRKGESLDHPSACFVVLDVSRRKINRLKVILKNTNGNGHRAEGSE